MMALPLFPQQGFPTMVRNGIALALLAGVYPMLQTQMPADFSPIDWVAFTIKESFIGYVMGYAIGSMIWALESVGALIDNQAGMNNANIFDPFGGHEGGPYAGFLSHTAVVVFVLFGGLPVLASLMYESFTLWPMQSFVPTLGAGYAALALGEFQSKAAWTVSLVAPILTVLVVIEIGIGLINRVASELNAFYFAMPIKAITAALMVAVLLSFWVDVLHGKVQELPKLLGDWNAAWR